MYIRHCPGSGPSSSSLQELKAQPLQTGSGNAETPLAVVEGALDQLHLPSQALDAATPAAVVAASSSALGLAGASGLHSELHCSYTLHLLKVIDAVQLSDMKRYYME